MDESALRKQLTNLETLRSSMHSSFRFWEWMVILGLIIDGVVILKEFWHDREDFQRGIVHPPERPSLSLLVLALLGTGLIVFGISKELAIDSRIERVETQVRGANDQLFGIVSQEAENAEKKSETAGTKADEIQGRLDAASRQLGQLEGDIRVQGPRWKILEDRREEFISTLKPFAGQQVIIVRCGTASPEQEGVEQTLWRFLGGRGKGSADWNTSFAIGRRWMWPECGSEFLIGGFKIVWNEVGDKKVEAAAQALAATLKHLSLATTGERVSPEQAQLLNKFLGVDSPQANAIADPPTIFVVVGPNVMFDPNARDKSGKTKKH